MYSQSGIGEKVHQEIMSEYPTELLDDHRRLSAWIAELSQRYGKDITIRLIDPQSGLGVWKSLRYWIRGYPAFVVNGKDKYIGWDKDALEAILQKVLRGQSKTCSS